MEKKPFYITTPIYYPSGNPHIGHCTPLLPAILLPDTDVCRAMMSCSSQALTSMV